MPLTVNRHPVHAQFVVRGKMDQPMHARQWYESPGRLDGKHETWCYTDRLSYAVDDVIQLRAISTADSVEVAVEAEFGGKKTVANFPSVPVGWQETPDDASTRGCGWPTVLEISPAKDWQPGVYKIKVRPKESESEVFHLIVLRPEKKKQTGGFLLVTTDASWNAYNDWGGSNHYEGIINPDQNLFSPILSNQRPLTQGMISLPDTAPRTLQRRTGRPDANYLYPHMHWAWNNGYSKKYASTGWASYEKPFLAWADQNGYCFDVITQQDLHFRPQLLQGYSCLVFVGHDEYWSWQMRDAIDEYIETGGNVARFAGNFMWQIRLQDQGQTQVCYKYLASENDPVRGSAEENLLTTSWEDPRVGRPGHSTFGLDASAGIYAGWGGLAANGAGGFTLYRPNHWAFDGCHLGYGDVLGRDCPIFGYEVDGLEYTIEDGLPYPVLSSSLPEDLEILGMGLARLNEDAFGYDQTELFVANTDAAFIANLRFANTSKESLESVNRGSGMMVSFTRGKGQVFHAGTTEWVAGLIYKDPNVERVTKNVLNKFISD